MIAEQLFDTIGDWKGQHIVRPENSWDVSWNNYEVSALDPSNIELFVNNHMKSASHSGHFKEVLNRKPSSLL